MGSLLFYSHPVSSCSRLYPLYMVDYNKLYDTYVNNEHTSKDIDLDAMLLPYAQQCSIVITENEIILGSENNPLNRIPKRNICTVVDEENEIHIVLRSSIYTINKNTGETKIDIRNL